MNASSMTLFLTIGEETCIFKVTWYREELFVQIYSQYNTYLGFIKKILYLSGM